MWLGSATHTHSYDFIPSLLHATQTHRIYLQRATGRPMVWTLLRYSPLAALEEEHEEANEHTIALRAASRKRRQRRGVLGRLRRAGSFVVRCVFTFIYLL
jgi:hypothetical protein